MLVSSRHECDTAGAPRQSCQFAQAGRPTDRGGAVRRGAPLGGTGRACYAPASRLRGMFPPPVGVMTEEEERQIREELDRLRQEHRDLDEAIAAMEAMGMGDPIRRQRLKKQKLKLKDRIVLLEDKLLPDIIA